MVEEGNHEDTVKLVREALAEGMPAVDILEKGLVPGVQALGELFKDGQAFLPEVLISTRAMNHGLEEIKPLLAEADVPKKGTVVLGTVEGDIHDIGKNLVGMMLGGNGYNVIDVGVDATADAFTDAVKEHKADIVAMSGLLTTTIPYFKTVIDALAATDLKDRIKVMIGGAIVSRSYADEIGAQGFAEDCVRAIDEANRLMNL
jgi:5-methyltetrahydrofolate--homocysteine methyltransferase